LAEIDGSIVAVGSLDWVHGRFQTKFPKSQLADLESSLGFGFQPGMESCSNYSKSIVYVGREGEGIIGAIAISDVLRLDAKSTVSRYMSHILLSQIILLLWQIPKSCKVLIQKFNKFEKVLLSITP
jgi:cation transport ATPase